VKDIVVPVTLFAAWCIGIVQQEGLSMDAPCVVSHLNAVATAAIDRFQIISMGEAFICRISMAGNATVAVMDRTAENLGIHKHGYCFTA
jgi:hypothetical protein